MDSIASISIGALVLIAFTCVPVEAQHADFSGTLKL